MLDKLDKFVEDKATGKNGELLLEVPLAIGALIGLAGGAVMAFVHAWLY